MCHGVVPPTLLLLTLCAVLTAGQEWGEWKAWTECQFPDSSCGPGHKYRERECQSGQCEGNWQEEDVCFGPPCSGSNSAIWTLWSEWTVCTAPGCNTDGRRSRWRECRGSECPTDKVETSTEEGCRLQPPCKKDGAWSGWSAWSVCSATCGQGYQYRQRNCTGVENGGDLCTGADYQNKACLAAQPVCFREASWGPWGFWDKLYEGDHPCRVRRRNCELPYPLNPDKRTCTGEDKQEKNCD